MRRGNVFFIIIAVLAIIFSMLTYFIKGTIEEKHITQRSLRVLQVENLAEAALERAIVKLKKELNDSQNFNKTDSLASFIRKPLKKNKSSSLGNDKFGKDYQLELASEKEFIYTKEDLESDLGQELTESVKFMAGDNTTFEANVKIKVSKAYGIGVGPSAIVPDQYKVPGVDMPWNINEAVMKFLDNQGYSALTLEFPDDLKLFSLKINLVPGLDGILGTKKITSEGTEYRDGGASTGAFKNPFEIDVIKLLTTFAEKSDEKNGEKGIMTQILEKNELDKLLRWISDSIANANEMKSFYPIEIKLAQNIFPDISSKLPYPTPAQIDDSYSTEKYGFLDMDVEVSMTFQDKQTISKTLKAQKEFKCSDIEPIAPLYSFFINNTNDDYLNFNSVGGNLTINNFSSISRINGSNKSSDPEKMEFPGLIRINGTQDTTVNVGFIGNPFSNNVDGADNALKKFGKNAEWPLIIDHTCKNAAVGASTQFYDVKEKVNSKYRDKFVQLSNQQIARTNPDTFRRGADGRPSVMTPPSPPAEHKTNFKANFEKGNFKTDIKGGLQNLFNKFPVPNIVPPMTKDALGVYFFEPPIHFAKDYMKNESGISGANIFNDSFSKWDWPVFGYGFDQFRIPIPTTSQTTTQLFGFASAYPTLTKGIEGNVLKRARQWHLGIMSFPCLPPPFGKQIPTLWGPLLPIWFPVWHTHDIETKYEYNLWLLKEADASGNMELTGSPYDPTQLANHPPNLYTVEQYAKKAAFYYETAEDFYKDIPNRTITENGKECLNLAGVTYIQSSVTLPPPGQTSFIVTGKGSIVTGGNIVLNGTIEDAWSESQELAAKTPRTIFSLVARSGGMIVNPSAGPAYMKIEGSLYTDKGISVPSSKALKIVGNWVTNAFCKLHLMGEVKVEYVGYKTRSSLVSINPDKGIYDPDRYEVTLSPGWSSWKIQ